MKEILTKIENNKYTLNEYQSFYVDRDVIRKNLYQEINFPILIVDTEFFNHSHFDPDDHHASFVLYDENETTLIYTLCYSIANSYKDLVNRKSKKAISTLYVRRKAEDKNFDFKKEMNKMLTTFVNICLHKNIKTLVFAGMTNDVSILENWINLHPSLLNSKETSLFYRDKDKKIKIRSFDIYETLVNGFSFSNFKKDGSQFYDPKNLEKGNQGEETIKLPGLKMFFNYFADYYEDNFDEKHEIYNLCVRALKFYSYLEFKNQIEFNYLNGAIKEVRNHCRNDVLKLHYLIEFIYECLNED